MKQKDQTHHRNDDKLFHQFIPQVKYRSLDQIGAVIHFDQFHPVGQAAFQLFDFILNRIDGVQRVLAPAHNNDSAYYFAQAVEVGYSTPHLRP